MSQHDMVLDNAAGAAFRADLNNALLALAGSNSGTTAPATTYPYQFWADTTTGLLKVRNAANSAWLIVGTLASDYLGNVPQSNLQAQTYTAFTTGGTSTAFTLTPTPASAANTTNQRYRIKFNAAAGTTPTLAVSGQAALALKYRDSTGAKQAITATQVPINWISDVENDGTDWVVLSVAIIPGVTTNSSAPTGYIGEYVESTVALGAAVSLTTGVVTNITSISLTAGDWDVSGVVIMGSGGTTNVTRVSAGTSSTSDTADVTKGYYSHIHSGYVPGGGQFRAMPLNTSRFSLSGTTTIYLVALANFTVSTCTAYGTISARRVR